MAFHARFSRWFITLAVTAVLTGNTLADTRTKTVRVWHTETERQTIDALTAIAGRFEARHPGVKIALEGLGWSELEAKITAALTAGTPPELSHGQPITCAGLQAKGLLLPIDDVIDALGRDNLLPQARQVCAVGGRTYGLPHAVATSMFVHRKDLADKAGLKAPESWADVLAAAKALTQDTDNDGKIDMFGVSLPGDNLFITIILGELITANGGALFDADNQPLLTDARMIEALDYFKALTRYAAPGWERQTYLQSYQNLIGGKAAIMLSGFGRGAGMIERSVPKEMANDSVFGVWTKPRGPSGDSPATQADEEPWMLFKDAAHPEEAKAFLRFFFEDRNYLEYVSTVPIHLLPVTLSLRGAPDYRGIGMFQRWRSWIDMQEAYLDKDQAKPTLVTQWSDLARKPYLLDVLNSGILRDMVMDVAIEGESARAAAERAHKRVSQLLAAKGYATMTPAVPSR